MSASSQPALAPITSINLSVSFKSGLGDTIKRSVRLVGVDASTVEIATYGVAAVTAAARAHRSGDTETYDTELAVRDDTIGERRDAARAALKAQAQAMRLDTVTKLERHQLAFAARKLANKFSR
jgi:hypothetical protein